MKLCEHFKLDYLVKRIQENPAKYKNWVFDGCSCLRDEKLGFITGCDWRDITFKCCLPHDLCYGYGENGNEIERERVDLNFTAIWSPRPAWQNGWPLLFWQGFESVAQRYSVRHSHGHLPIKNEVAFERALSLLRVPSFRIHCVNRLIPVIIRDQLLHHPHAHVVHAFKSESGCVGG